MPAIVLSALLHAWTAAALLAPCVFPDAHADTLDVATVTASRIRTIQVQRLEGEALQRLSSESVADALRYFSGVQVKDYGGIGGLKTVNVRSLGAQHTAVYYNGVKLTNAQNGQVDLGRFSLENVESVTLYNGQKSEVLQTATDFASAASVYIQQKSPEQTETKIRVQTGAFGTFSPTLFQSFVSRDGKWKASVNYSFLDTHGKYRFTYHYPDYDTTVVRHNGDVRSHRAEALLSYGDLKLNGYYFSSDRGLPGPVVRRVSDQYNTKDRQQDGDGFVQATCRHLFGKVMVQGIAKYAHNKVRYDSNPALNAAAMPIDNHYRQNEVYGSLSSAWFPLPWFSAGLSVDERWNDLDCDVPGFSYVQRFTTLCAANVQFSYAGAKFQPSLLYTHTHDNTVMAAADKSAFTPAFFLNYQWKFLTARAFYKEIFRLPTFDDLYYTTTGYRNLRPEYTRQLDGGFELSRWGLTLTVDAYLSMVWDKIVAMPIQNQFSWSMVNYGQVEGRGLDIAVGCTLDKADWHSSTQLKYNYEIAKDITDPTSRWYRCQIPYTPWYSGSFISNLQYRTWGASLSFLYTGVRYRDIANIEENRLDPWITTDVSLSKDFRFRKVGMTVALDLNNIFNQPYEVITNYPMPGFHAFLKVTLTL